MHCISIGNGHPLNKPIVHTKSKENCVKTFLIKLITSSIANYRKKSDLVIVTRGRRRGGGKGDQEGRGYTTIKENSGRRVRETGNRWVGIMGENQT